MEKARITRIACLFSLFTLAGLALPAASTGQTGGSTPDSLRTGVLISDIHFDPFADPSQPAWKAYRKDEVKKYPENATEQEQNLVKQLAAVDDRGWDQPEDVWCAQEWDAILKNQNFIGFPPAGLDSNYRLMTSALQSAGSKPFNGLVIYTGDLVRHDIEKLSIDGSDKDSPTNRAFRATTAIYTVQKLQQAFGAPVIVALGNNDSVNGDYQMTANDPTFLALAKNIRVIREGGAEVQADFKYGGFYSIPDPTVSHQDLVVLNTVFWATKPTSTTTPDPGEVEMGWLRYKLTLAQSRRRTVRLIMHIPPGINGFSSHATADPFWPDPINKTFLELLREFRGTVVTSFAGHTHQDEFRVVSTKDDENGMPFGSPFLAIRISPSVSPSNGNNPAFTLFTYGSQCGDVEDLTTYYNPLGNDDWPIEYRFSETYGPGGGKPYLYNAVNLFDLARTIRSGADTSVLQKWQKLYNVSALPAEFDITDLKSWGPFSVVQTNFTTEAYENAYRDFTNSPAKLAPKRP